MNFIHGILPNYGVAIIILTILIKLLFWPLGTKSYKSMHEMKKVQPLMMEIREKYKDDKQRMNQETMALYKTYKVNPASGCLPLLVQMPIFFALYRMLYMAIELRHAPFVGWITDLSGPDRLFHFNFAIPFMEAPSGIPVLTLLMGASFLLQQKMAPTTGRSHAGKNDDAYAYIHDGSVYQLSGRTGSVHVCQQHHLNGPAVLHTKDLSLRRTYEPTS